MKKPTLHPSHDEPVPQSVVAVVFNKEKTAVLLIKRRDVPMWALPGGGIDPGEKPEEAALREVFEETGLRAGIVRQVALYLPINRLAKVTCLYECVSEEETGLLKGPETTDVAFFPLDALPSPFFFLHQDWIDETRINSPELIRKKLTNITYFELLKYILRDPVPVIRLILSRLGIPLNKKDH